ncbi:hypothetical protein TKK_0004178 [Trichogramma kaykai]
MAERYANDHIHWTPENWQHVFAVDEKVVSSAKDGRNGVWRLKATRYEPENIIPTVYSGRVNRSYWACCSGNGPGSIFEISRRMNMWDYQTILNDSLLPTVLQTYLRDEVIYIVEDNSSVHTSRVVRAWYANQPRLHRLNHSRKSPDLNFCENMWFRMVKKRIPANENSIAILRQQVTYGWQELFDDLPYFKRLTDSMPRRPA